MEANEITWNPELSAWDDQRQCAVRVRRGERVVKGFRGREYAPSDAYWRATCSITPGERVYLVKTGAEPRGWIASGYIVAAPDSRSYTSAMIGEGEVCNYFLFDVLLDLTSEQPLGGYPNPGPPEDANEVDVNALPTGSTISGEDDPTDDAEWKEHVAAQRPLRVAHFYTRQHLYELLKVPELLRGGDWATGYHRHNGDWYVFANVGLPGRTGHDYENRWIGNDLLWHGKTNSRIDHESILSMLGDTANVHVFTRADDRSPFTYEGVATATNPEATVPVTITWRFNSGAQDVSPEEVLGADRFVEGAVWTVSVNVYERDRGARRACIAHWGTSCVVCGFNFAERYGDMGQNYIQVHHLTPLATVAAEYTVDPVNDLRPVCANCHVMLHRTDPPATIEALRQRLVDRAGTLGNGVA